MKLRKVNLDVSLKPLIPKKAREFVQVEDRVTCIPSYREQKARKLNKILPSGFSISCTVYKD